MEIEFHTDRIAVQLVDALPEADTTWEKTTTPWFTERAIVWRDRIWVGVHPIGWDPTGTYTGPHFMEQICE